MSWIQFVIQWLQLFQLAKYWRVAVICFAVLLILIAILFGSVALAIFAFALILAAFFVRLPAS